jgi:hypothetical protein
MDRITQSMLTAFVTAEGLQTLPESEAFERFANSAVMTSLTSDTVGLEDVSCGSGNDTGLDGIAIIVNGSIVTTEEEVDALVETNGYLDAHFVFVQAKTTSGFSGADIGTFLFGVNDFFSETPRLPRNEFVIQSASVQRHIFSMGAKMTRRRPLLSMFYVTTGQWQNDAQLNARIQSARTDLVALNLFEQVDFKALGAAEIQGLYRATQTKVSAEFTFANKIVLPEMPGVSEAYLGVLPASEFLRLVSDASGNIRKSVFYDNVRDFQDYNSVNSDIQQTLRTADRSRFAILNNGVTLVAKALRPVGNRFHVEDYQVVNGCQTSHVLFDNRAVVDASVMVPLKVIVLSDEGIANSVIKATNRQTAVKPQQLYALSDFQKRLEQFFASFDLPHRLYYERRARQYATDAGVEKVRVVSTQQQLRVFAAMFLDEAHKGHYARALDALVGTSIFIEAHQLEPYYAAAYAYYRLEYFFRSGALAANLKPARYDILLAARHLFRSPLPTLTSNAAKRYGEDLIQLLRDDTLTLDLFQRSGSAVLTAARGRTLDRALTKKQTFTAEVLNEIPR